MEKGPRLFGDEENIRHLKDIFHKSLPFKYILIDNFLDEQLAEEICTNFPKKNELSRHYNGLNENKSEGAAFDQFHPSFRELRMLLNSKSFIDDLTTITGINGLFSTEDSLGSGVHQGDNGSFLDIHVDFNIHHLQKVHRRINMLIFLNKDWKAEYGGALEFWDKNVRRLEQSYLPIYNRCVIFETNDFSYHGYSKIKVPEGISRNSFYTYYYTPLGDYKRKFHDTVFKARPEEGVAKKVKTNVKEFMKNSAKRTLLKLGIKF